TIMMFLPLLFLTVIARFPTGLVLYWMTTNLWTVGQGLITRRLVPKPGAVPAAPPGPRRSSRTPPKEAAAPAGNGPTSTQRTSTQQKPPRPPQQPRRVKKKGGAHR